MVKQIDNELGVSTISPVVVSEMGELCEVCGKTFENLVGTKPSDNEDILIAYEKGTGNEVYFHKQCIILYK